MSIASRLAPYQVRRPSGCQPEYGIHQADMTSLSRHPDCRCGSHYWDGLRWRALPDQSAYMDPPDASGG